MKFLKNCSIQEIFFDIIFPICTLHFNSNSYNCTFFFVCEQHNIK